MLVVADVGLMCRSQVLVFFLTHFAVVSYIDIYVSPVVVCWYVGGIHTSKYVGKQSFVL